MSSHYQKAYFLLSVADIKQLPEDQGVEIALAGRSNAGKSSVLNRITQQRGLARVSKTPGRTQLINIFAIDDRRRLVDLPGYGYAKAPLGAKQKWQGTIDTYLSVRTSLRGLILIMDIRHPLTSLDRHLLIYAAHRQLPVHIVLNKSDKLSKNAVFTTLQQVESALTDLPNSVTLQSFSALKGTGVKDLHLVLNKWLYAKTISEKSETSKR